MELKTLTVVPFMFFYRFLDLKRLGHPTFIRLSKIRLNSPSIHGSSLYIQGAFCCVIHLVQFDRVVEVDEFLSLLLPGTKIVNTGQPPHSGQVKNSQKLSIRGETSLPAA